MKVIAVSTLLLSSLMLNASYADDTLIKEPAPVRQLLQADKHIAWHDFRHELTSFPRVNASMSHNGVVTLSGFVATPVQIDKLDALASQVMGVTKVVNRTGMK